MHLAGPEPAPHTVSYRDSYRNINRPVITQPVCHSRRSFLLPDIRLSLRLLN
jgi:hypothetical protein